jgi:4-oxalocrotonate tautomerase
MPIIIFESGQLAEQIKEKLIDKLTDISVEITGIPKSLFFVTIREFPDENIAVGGKTVKALKMEISRQGF